METEWHGMERHRILSLAFRWRRRDVFLFLFHASLVSIASN